MSSESEGGDVTLWIESLREGDDAAATQLWEYCFPRLLRYSKRRLPEHLRKVMDEEDVALSAFKSLVHNAQRGGLAEVESRESLWKLLTCIAARKASGYVRHEKRKKRGGGLVRGESIFQVDGESAQPGIQQVPNSNQEGGLIGQFGEQCCELLELLDDDTLRAIAILRMEGYSVEEVAERIGCSKRSVERRLSLVRRIWQESEKDKQDDDDP